ncbi:unnamed protein product [Ranitomeya imitator]|uniref:CARD domain-containing protein n=1 Tax=Ranitomeya imitator TaxID=111125 RepID=A0ABN9M980_9NEOB|nr:unnamed protein product [Ranitomeya imitator]
MPKGNSQRRRLAVRQLRGDSPGTALPVHRAKGAPPRSFLSSAMAMQRAGGSEQATPSRLPASSTPPAGTALSQTTGGLTGVGSRTSSEEARRRGLEIRLRDPQSRALLTGLAETGRSEGTSRVPFAGRKDICHSGVLEHYQQLIVKHLTLTSPVYRRLKENGILSTEQIGLLEDGNQGKHRVTKRGPALSYPMFTLVTSEDIAESLEESSDRKVAKLIDVLKSKDHHMFTSFCAVLHETGHHHLAQVLQTAINNKTPLLPEVSQHKHALSESIMLHKEYDKKLKEENMQLRRKIQRMQSKFMTKYVIVLHIIMSILQDLEEKITLAKWERDLAIKEKNILHNENEALQNLNSELQALVRKLEETAFRSDLRNLRTHHSNMKDLGFSVDYLKEKSRRFYPETHLGLVYSLGTCGGSHEATTEKPLVHENHSLDQVNKIKC